jgi:hypothetical protein
MSSGWRWGGGPVRAHLWVRGYPAGSALSDLACVIAGSGSGNADKVTKYGWPLSRVSAVPPRLTDVLTALTVEASRDEYQAAEDRLGISSGRLPGIRSEPAAEVDGSGLTPSQVREWLARLPVRPDEEASVIWVADRIGARMTFRTFVSNFDDLWFPAMDDVVVLLDSRQALDVLVLDHEERITLSRVIA